jgi:hypothetical protein
VKARVNHVNRVNQTGGRSVLQGDGPTSGDGEHGAMSNWDFGRPPAEQDNAAGRPADSFDAPPPSPSPSPRPYAPGAEAYEPAAQPYGPAAQPYGPPQPYEPDDEWVDDPDNPLTPPYPLTYERDEDGLPAGWAPWARSEDPADRFARDPFADERPVNARTNADLWQDGFDHQGANPGAGNAGNAGDGGQPTMVWPEGPLTQQRWRSARDTPTLTDARGLGAPGGPDWPGHGPGHAARRGGGRRWVIPGAIAVVAAAVGATTVLLTGGHSATPSATGSAPAGTGGTAGPNGTGTVRGTPTASAGSTAGPLTAAQAQGVLAGYSALNNEANAQRSDSLLGTIETGSSYAIDAGQYLMQLAAGAAAYPAFGPVRATYYIPRAEPAGGPRWFVAEVANAFTSGPQKVASTEYLLFTQSAPSGRWQDAIEPFVLTGANAPQIATGADGLATAVSPAATSVAVPPGQLAAATAVSLDGAGQIASPGNLADQSDLRFWQGKLPTANVTDTHAATTGPDGQEFALLATNGGALVFYTDTATLTVTAPAGSALHLTVPGLYSPDQALSSAVLSYQDQFAAYDPPAGANAGAPTVIADYSGITGKN